MSWVVLLQPRKVDWVREGWRRSAALGGQSLPFFLLTFVEICDVNFHYLTYWVYIITLNLEEVILHSTYSIHACDFYSPDCQESLRGFSLGNNLSSTGFRAAQGPNNEECKRNRHVPFIRKSKCCCRSTVPFGPIRRETQVFTLRSCGFWILDDLKKKCLTPDVLRPFLQPGRLLFIDVPPPTKFGRVRFGCNGCLFLS